MLFLVKSRLGHLNSNRDKKIRIKGQKMPFQKGVSGNPAGKPKGTKHEKSDEAIREFLRSKSEEYFYGTGSNSFLEDMKNITPSMRLQLWEKYIKYYLPAMQSLQVEGEITNNIQGAVRIVIEEVEATKNYIDITPISAPAVNKGLSDGR